MEMKFEFPPNYASVIAAFPWVERTKGVIFAWDLTIFNPDRILITPSLRAHEEVHSLRQKGDPASWWDKYLTDPAFRYAEEVPAHIIEYRTVCGVFPRNKRRLQLNDIAARLAGPLYGHLTNIAMAKTLLKTGARVLLDPQPQGA